ncbi:MAG: methylenetetrahydrofolate reductase C-terminal domain-containing protein [candidate division NC10 bacterium]|nr:methylenetetrahydrofolate reductase C-terminal domain-containing protein [candidate division NC10 bacterium]
MENQFKKAMLDDQTFVVTCELIPGLGSREKAQEKVLEFSEKACKGGKVHALSICDNAGGNPSLEPDPLALEIQKMGQVPLIHFTGKDKNRAQMLGKLYSYDRAGLENLLIMTGDYPADSVRGKAKPVFDLDPIHLLQLTSAMNGGLEWQGITGRIRLQPTSFFKGSAVSPFKQLESELIPQYLKLINKVAAGADFLITQLGFDARKFDELMRFMKLKGLKVPVIGNVYVLNLGAARLMNGNELPGCVVSDALLAKISEEAKAPDKGKGERLLRSAKLVALLRGLGYKGVHLGGVVLPYEDVEFILAKAEELYPNWPDWVKDLDFPQKNVFYYFERDEKTGLNTDVPVDRSRNLPGKSLTYQMFRLVHDLAFDEKGILYRPARAFHRAIADTFLEKPYAMLEHLCKVMSNECKMCGDCTLPEHAYLCPQSQCAKYLLNGPCGGSYEGWCEIHYGKKQCIYVRAYDRLKPHGEHEDLLKEILPPRDWSLNETSSWVNFYLDRDHAGKKKQGTPEAKA